MSMNKIFSNLNECQILEHLKNKKNEKELFFSNKMKNLEIELSNKEKELLIRKRENKIKKLQVQINALQEDSDLKIDFKVMSFEKREQELEKREKELILRKHEIYYKSKQKKKELEKKDKELRRREKEIIREEKEIEDNKSNILLFKFKDNKYYILTIKNKSYNSVLNKLKLKKDKNNNLLYENINEILRIKSSLNISGFKKSLKNYFKNKYDKSIFNYNGNIFTFNNLSDEEIINEIKNKYDEIYKELEMN